MKILTYISVKSISLFFIFHFSLSTHIAAQTDTNGLKRTSDRYFISSKIIFQGKIISSKPGVRVKISGGRSVNLDFYLVEVQKILKGNIQKGTIEITQKSGDGIVYDEKGNIQYQVMQEDGTPPPPSEGIYFSHSFKNDSTINNSNSKSLDFIGAITLSNGEIVKERRGITQYFTKLSDLYAYIKANYGIDVDGQ
jgi:hypothetical protein